MHQKSAEFDMQGCTLTHIHRISEDTSPELVQISHGHTLIWLHPEISVSTETKRWPISPKTHIVLHKIGQIDIPYSNDIGYMKTSTPYFSPFTIIESEVK